MRKLHSYGPSLIVLATALAVLLGGPLAVQRLTEANTKARIIQASRSLAENGVLEELNQAYRDIATIVEPSVVHISTEQTSRDRWAIGSKALPPAPDGSMTTKDTSSRITTSSRTPSASKSSSIPGCFERHSWSVGIRLQTSP